MKLWQVIQWGNRDEGADGPDTQCIVSAVDMPTAITKACFLFDQWNSYNEARDGVDSWRFYKLGIADAVYLLGQDNKPDGEALLVVPIWISHAFNSGGSPAWFRHPIDNEWLDQKTIFTSEYLHRMENRYNVIYK